MMSSFLAGTGRNTCPCERRVDKDSPGWTHRQGQEVPDGNDRVPVSGIHRGQRPGEAGLGKDRGAPGVQDSEAEE